MRTDKTRIIPEQVIRDWTEHYCEYHCDGCGKLIDRINEGDDCHHDLVIALDQYECAGFIRSRDYCPACLEPIWRAVNQLIKADPEKERDPGND
jgi:hypothetical protein